jgi:hypothetical protein
MYFEQQNSDSKTTELPTLQQPNHIISLATSALLVSVDINVWSATKQDRVISNEVTTAKRADSNAGRFVKNLLSNNVYHKDLINYRQTIYNWIKRNTYRWNNSQDLLPTIALEDFKTEYDKHESKFNELLDTFCVNYDSIRSNIAFSQGDMYNADDYPEVEEVRRKFGCKLYVSEVPEQDFRCQVSHALASDLKQSYEKQAQEIVKNVLHQQIERITEVMESIAHCCGTQEITTENGEVKSKKRKIYDTTLEKAKDLCRTYAQFKVLDNADSRLLQETIVSLDRVLTGIDSELLRESDSARDRVKSGVEDILSKFSF